MHPDGRKILNEFYLRAENSILYDIDEALISKASELFALRGFDELHGADMVCASIAYVENAYLVTLDKQFIKSVSQYIKVIDLNDSRGSASYRAMFETAP